MALYLVHLLEPLFDHVRLAFLQDPVAHERLVPILCSKEASMVKTVSSFPLWSDFSLNDTAVLQRLCSFIENSFPEPCISALQHIPSFSGYVSRYINHFSITIHGRIAEALAMEVAQKRLDKSVQMLHFLIIVNIIHDLAHILRSFFHGVHLQTQNLAEYPYAIELSNTISFPEAGFMAEQAFFGGIIGVVFEDEIDEQRPPFFQIKFDKISHFFLQCADGKAYRLSTLPFLFYINMLARLITC